jgi:hypothetical protein
MIDPTLLQRFPILTEIEAYCARESAGASMARRHQVLGLAKADVEKLGLNDDERNYIVSVLQMACFDGVELVKAKGKRSAGLFN